MLVSCGPYFVLAGFLPVCPRVPILPLSKLVLLLYTGWTLHPMQGGTYLSFLSWFTVMYYLHDYSTLAHKQEAAREGIRPSQQDSLPELYASR